MNKDAKAVKMLAYKLIFFIELPKSQVRQLNENILKIQFCIGKKKKNKGEGKIHPRTGYEVPEGEYKNISSLSLTSALDVSGWLTPCPCLFALRKIPDTHFTGGPVGPRAGLTGVEILDHTGI